MNSPLVSVVIPAFNAKKWIAEAIDSVLAQTFEDYEIVVVDDGSTDATEQALGGLIRAKQIRFFRQQNSGVSAARNRGVDESRGELIAFLDADDLFHPEKLRKQVALFDQQPDLGFVYANFEKFADAGGELGVRDMGQFRGRVYPGILQEWSALMALPTLMVPKQVFQALGGFDESVSWGEDIDLYFRITREYAIDLVPEALCRVRVHPASASASKLGSAESFHRVLEKALQADPSLSADFGRRAFANLYVNKAQNLLGEGAAPEMRAARDYARKALSYGPASLPAWLTLLASWIPQWLRAALAGLVRRLRYPRRAG